MGLTIDSLLAVELVTADGKVRIVDAAHEPDLFWALRGGGGNFGVATGSNSSCGRCPNSPAACWRCRRRRRRWRASLPRAQAAPEALSTIANVMPAPPIPFLPPEVHGKLIILGMLAFADRPARRKIGLRVSARARRLCRFRQAGAVHPAVPTEDPNYRPTAADGHLRQPPRRAEAETILDTLEAGGASFRMTRSACSAAPWAPVPVDATAYAHRKAPIMLDLAAFWTSPETRSSRKRGWSASSHR